MRVRPVPRAVPRGALVAALVAVLALAASACSAPGGGGVEPITLMLGRDATSSGELAVLLNRWRDVNPDSPVRLVELPATADQQHESLVKDAQDDSSTTDVYGLDVTWVTEFAAEGYVEELDDVDLRPFLDGPRRTGLYPPSPGHAPPTGGDVYAVPYTTDAGLLYYRRDLVSSAPTSWDGIRLLPASLQGAGLAGVYAGQLADYEGLTVGVLEVLGSVAPGKSLFEAGMPALNRAVDLLRPRVGDGLPVIVPDALTFDENASVQAMRDGKVALLRGWPVAFGTLVAPSPEDPGRAARFGITQVPGGAPVLGGQDLAVSSHSRHADRARGLIDFLTNPKSQRDLLVSGAPAARADAYAPPIPIDPQLAEELPRAVQSAVNRPAGRCYPQFSALFHRAVHDSLATGSPLSDDLLDRLAGALDCRPV